MTDYQELTDLAKEAEVVCKDKKVRIIGSLSEAVAQLLDEVYHNKPDMDFKRTILSQESNPSTVNTLVAITEGVENTTDSIIATSADSLLDEHLLSRSREILDTESNVILLTANNTDVYVNSDLEKKRDSLEAYALSRGRGHRVFRIVG